MRLYVCVYRPVVIGDGELRIIRRRPSVDDRLRLGYDPSEMGMRKLIVESQMPPIMAVTLPRVIAPELGQ